MLENYERGYTVPVDGDSDSDAINHAISEAVACGLRKTIIPRYNARTGSCRWELDAPVMVPEHFTLEIQNATVSFTQNGTILAIGEEQNPLERIRIYGTGNAEFCEEDAFGAILRLAFVHDVKVHDIHIKTRTARGIFCLGITESKISDITFSSDFPEADTDISAQKNACGISLSAGCNNVTLSHIYGKTLGDTIEISAVSKEAEAYMTRDILVRDVRSDCYTYSNVRLVNGDGHFLQNIVIDGVTDTSKEGSTYRARSTVSIGEAPFGRTPAQLGEIRNLTVKNITSRAFAAVNTVHAIQDITIADITMREDGGCALSCDRSLAYNNIYLCNVKFDDRTTSPYPIELVRKPAYLPPMANDGKHMYPYRAVCNMRDIHGTNFKINGIYANTVDNLLRITGKNRIEMYDVDIPNIVYDDIVGDDCAVNDESAFSITE